MKKSDENQRKECEKTERLLVEKQHKKITESDIRFIKNHLSSCSLCQNYQTTLQTIEHAVQIDPNLELTPDPLIRNNIIKKMKSLKPEKVTLAEKIWFGLKHILAYRIPVYQACFGAVSVILIVFLINKLPMGIDQDFPGQQEYTQPSGLIPAQTNAIKNLEIINRQQIGRNVKEDTLLTKFIVNVM